MRNRILTEQLASSTQEKGRQGRQAGRQAGAGSLVPHPPTPGPSCPPHPPPPAAIPAAPPLASQIAWTHAREGGEGRSGRSRPQGLGSITSFKCRNSPVKSEVVTFPGASL